MERSTWLVVASNVPSVLTVDDEGLHLLRFEGRKGKKQAEEAVKLLSSGADLGQVTETSFLAFRLVHIKSLEISESSSGLVIRSFMDSDFMIFDATSDDEALAIVKNVLGRTDGRLTETREEISVKDALMPVVISAAVAFIGFSVLFSVAVSAEIAVLEGEDKVSTSGRRQLLKTLLLWLATQLGSNGVMALGALTLGGCAAWGYRRWRHRPVSRIWVEV